MSRNFFIRKHTIDRPKFILPIRLDGRGGAGILGVERLLSPSTVAASLKKDSNPACSSLTSVASRPKTRVSRVDSFSVFFRRRALCIASRAEGDGGRGAGFIA
jgi:hypothetical protein